MGVRGAPAEARPRLGALRPVRSALLVVAGLVMVLATACAPTSTNELSSDDAPDGYPAQAPDGYPSPQVMAEVTLPDGSVASVPQPLVPIETVPSTTIVPGGTGTTPTTPPDDRAVQRLGNDDAIKTASLALGRIRLDWRSVLPGWQVRFLPGRPGLRGATFPDTKVIEVYVRSSDSPSELAHVIAHELGHAVDVSRLDDADRAVWKATRGIDPSLSWFPNGSGVADYSTPAGDWAESFARWQSGTGWYSKLGPPPDVAQMAVLARLSGLG